MKPFVILSLLLLILGCSSGGASGLSDPYSLRDTMKVAFISNGFCCDPNGLFPQEIGTLRVTHSGSPHGAPVDVNLGGFTGGGIEFESGVKMTVKMEAGDVLDTKLYATGCDWDQAQADFGYRGSRGHSVVQRVELNNLCGPMPSLLDVMNLIAPPVDNVVLLRDSTRKAEIGVPVLWSAPYVDPLIPLPLWVEINRFGSFEMWLLHQTIEAIFGSGFARKPGVASTSLTGGAFPCGAGPNGYTVCSSMDVDPVEGDYVFAYLSAEEDIPLGSTRLITYGFVFDSDGDPSNNYVPHPSYPDDYFKDTDRWYTVEYDPAAGWTLVCRDATDSVVQEVPTAARAIIRDNVILLVAPQSEFGTTEPSYRVTAFTHTGDYGANPPHDWAGDQHPRVSEGLASFVRGN